MAQSGRWRSQKELHKTGQEGPAQADFWARLSSLTFVKGHGVKLTSFTSVLSKNGFFGADLKLCRRREENNRAQGRGTLRAVDKFIKTHANRWKCAKKDPGHPQVVTDLTGVLRVGVIFLLFKFVCNKNMLFYNSGGNHLYFKTKYFKTNFKNFF